MFVWLALMSIFKVPVEGATTYNGGHQNRINFAIRRPTRQVSSPRADQQEWHTKLMQNECWMSEDMKEP